MREISIPRCGAQLASTAMWLAKRIGVGDLTGSAAELGHCSRLWHGRYHTALCPSLHPELASALFRAVKLQNYTVLAWLSPISLDPSAFQ